MDGLVEELVPGAACLYGDHTNTPCRQNWHQRKAALPGHTSRNRSCSAVTAFACSGRTSVRDSTAAATAVGACRHRRLCQVGNCLVSPVFT